MSSSEEYRRKIEAEFSLQGNAYSALQILLEDLQSGGEQLLSNADLENKDFAFLFKEFLRQLTQNRRIDSDALQALDAVLQHLEKQVFILRQRKEKTEYEMFSGHALVQQLIESLFSRLSTAIPGDPRYSYSRREGVENLVIPWLFQRYLHDRTLVNLSSEALVRETELFAMIVSEWGSVQPEKKTIDIQRNKRGFFHTLFRNGAPDQSETEEKEDHFPTEVAKREALSDRVYNAALSVENFYNSTERQFVLHTLHAQIEQRQKFLELTIQQLKDAQTVLRRLQTANGRGRTDILGAHVVDSAQLLIQLSGQEISPRELQLYVQAHQRFKEFTQLLQPKNMGLSDILSGVKHERTREYLAELRTRLLPYIPVMLQLPREKREATVAEILHDLEVGLQLQSFSEQEEKNVLPGKIASLKRNSWYEDQTKGRNMERNWQSFQDLAGQLRTLREFLLTESAEVFGKQGDDSSFRR